MRPNPQRVAQRHLERQGGIFEAPPAMLRDITQWMMSMYAGHILKLTNDQLAKARNMEGVLQKSVDEMKVSLQRLPRDLASLQQGKSLRYNVYVASWDGVQTIAFGAKFPDFALFLRPDGSNQWAEKGREHPDDWEPHFELGRGKGRLKWDYGSFLVPDIQARITEALAVGIESLEKDIAQMNRREQMGRKTEHPMRSIVSMVLLQKECLKYTTRAKTFKTKVSQQFPVDLTGWGYIKPNAPVIKTINASLENYNDALDASIAMAKEGLEAAQEAYDEVTSGKAEGVWEYWTSIDYRPEKEHRSRIHGWTIKTPWHTYTVNELIEQGKRPTLIVAVPVMKDGVKTTENMTLSEAEKLRRPYFGPDDIEEAVKATHWRNGILVELHFKPHTSRGGVWMYSKMLLQVDAHATDASSVSSFQQGADWIKETARHEVQHVGQDLLRFIQGMKEDAGLPGKAIREPREPGNYKRKPHALRDVEFYTRIADEVEIFLRRVRKIPMGDRRYFVREVVGLSRGLSRNTVSFFKELKDNEPKKWQKAVAEFFKAIEERGVKIPGDKNMLSRVAEQHLRRTA